MSISNIDVIERVKEIASGIALPFRTTCPVCKGGTSNERTLSVYNGERGVMATCHRGTCSLRTITIVPFARSTILAQERSSVLQPEVDEESPPMIYLSEERLESVLRERYLPSVVAALMTFVPTRQLMLAQLQESYSKVLVFPQTDVQPLVSARGMVVRYIDPGVRIKSRTYALSPPPGTPEMRPWTRIGLYSGRPRLQELAERSEDKERVRFEGHILCVEDAVSAMVLAYLGCNACSLNGTLVNHDRWARIRRSGLGPKPMLLLDADATRTALRQSLRLDPSEVRVVRLVEDIKDMPVPEALAFLHSI